MKDNRTDTEQTTENETSQNGHEPDFTGARAQGASYRDPRLDPFLQPHHQFKLVEESGISVDTVLERGVFSYESPTELLLYDHRPGSAPGLIFPTFPPVWKEGDPPIFVVRPDVPAEPGKKYIWPTDVPVRLDCLPSFQSRLADSAIPLWIVEGIKKSDCLASRGKLVITLNGVDCFGGRAEADHPILKDWEYVKLAGREVIIGFDSDAQRNPNVKGARHRLTRFLRGRGAIVKWLILPDAPDGSKQGVDDFLAGEAHAY